MSNGLLSEIGGKSTKDAEKINSFILLLTIAWSIAELREPLFQEIKEPLILTKCQSSRLEIKFWSFSNGVLKSPISKNGWEVRVDYRSGKKVINPDSYKIYYTKHSLCNVWIYYHLVPQVSR